MGVTDGAVVLAVGVDGDANQRRGCGVLLLAIRWIRIRQLHRLFGHLKIGTHHLLVFFYCVLCIHLECHGACQRYDIYDSFHFLISLFMDKLLCPLFTGFDELHHLFARHAD